MMIPQPMDMTLQQWTDAAVLALDNFDSIGRMFGEDWQDWGVRLMTPLSLSGLNLPDPYGFTDWREWAQRLCEELT